MNLATSWIPAITDRTYIDVENAMNDPELENPKGVFNYTDLHRIENNTQYCIEYMMETGIIEDVPMLRIKTNWGPDDIVTHEDIERIITNILTLGDLSNPEIKPSLPSLYVTNQMNYILANYIEQYLVILHTQAETPVDKYYLEIVHGKIVSIEGLDGEIRPIQESNAWIAEGEIATIQGLAYGEDAPYQRFQYWSGNEQDIEHISNITAITTTYTAQPREVQLIANFKRVLPRTLTLTNAYISVNKDPHAETGPTEGIYYAGDKIMIIANIAAEGKTFNSWKGTQLALDSMSTSMIHQSTVTFTMPDCDTELSAFYINAGPHYVRIYSGDALVSEREYAYDEYFSITAPNRGAKYKFASWSGDTFYIDNLYRSTTSGKMSDVDIMFRANYDYLYSINTVTMTDGTINGVSKLTTAQENSSYTIQCTPPEGYGFDYWTLNGAGTFYDEQVNPTQFIVGDGNATITPHYAKLYSLILINVDNNGISTTTQEVEGKIITIKTQEVVDNYVFDYWEERGQIVSTESIYSFSMSDANRTLNAVYRAKNTINITINYGTYTETVSMSERTSRTIAADTPPAGKVFSHWSSTNIYSIENIWDEITSFVSGNVDGTVTANYYTPSGPVPEYHLVVNNGSGSGWYPENIDAEIEANEAPLGYEFDYWEVNSGPGYITNPYSSRTRVNIGDGDSTVTAHYKQIPSFLITVENGYVLLNGVWVTSGMCLRNEAPQIKIKPAPESHRFESWDIIEGDQNDIVQPLAETTVLRNVTHNIVVKASYYIPYSPTTYTLTIYNKDGTNTVSSYIAGEEIRISAEEPDEGYIFYRWNGDYKYLELNRNISNNIVKIPTKNIELWPSYVPETYTLKYNLYMYNAECLISRVEDEDTHEIVETWATSGEFEEGTEVEIRPISISPGWKFDGWETTTIEQSILIDDTEAPNTFITMSNFDCYVTAVIIEKNKYRLKITDGQVSGQYNKDASVPVYFSKQNTLDMHYVFNKWTGDDLADIKLYDGRPFSETTAGDSKHPQYIRMLAKKIKMVAQYTIIYHLVIYDGIISGTDEHYFAPNTTLNIVANTPPEGYVFQRWEGDVANIGSKWDPTTTITITDHPKSISAIYSKLADRNNIGYVLIDLLENDSINIEDITVISGEINLGFIITDSNGQLYIITNINNNIASIIRLTRTQKGGNRYE